MTEHTYDVAISFGFKDEAFANRLHALLQGRLKVFLYSKEQEKLAGTDGEATFNAVFGKEAKLVVVLFREAWGQSPFTRFEETAIRNRAYSEGYDFTVFIPMDDSEKQKVPAWLPKNRLYVGLDRWGIEGAAAAIEARFSELGGVVHDETIEDIAARAAQVLAFKKQRETHLSSDAGVAAQKAAYEIVRAGLLEGIEKLQLALPGIHHVEAGIHRGRRDSVPVGPRGDVGQLAAAVCQHADRCEPRSYVVARPSSVAWHQVIRRAAEAQHTHIQSRSTVRRSGRLEAHAVV